MHNISNYVIGMSKIFVWANSDIDGAASTILLGNIFPNITYKSVFFGDFLNQYTEWESEIEKYDKVFVVGMVLDQSLINKIDNHKLVIVSDRKETVNVFDSALISEEYSSCCKLLYKKFKSKLEFSNDLKKLILFADDYNSYELKHKESEYLNAIYRTITFNKFNTFVKRFWNGYDGLTDREVSNAEHFFNNISAEYSNLIMYEGEFRGWKVISTFSKMSVNEIAKKIMDNHNHDVVIIVNPDTMFVSFRKPNESSADICFMAQNLCEGGGGEWASGGKITQKFLDFTTKLIEL